MNTKKRFGYCVLCNQLAVLSKEICSECKKEGDFVIKYGV